MSAIRERTALCIIDLPKKLTSQRNLQAHFSTFGDVKDLSLNKELQSAIITFSTHFDAQSAKTKGNVYEGKPLSIYWSETTAVALDPRAREPAKEKLVLDKVESENLWDDDDKETFGVETVKLKIQNERKKRTDQIHVKQISKLSGVKKRLGPTVKQIEISKTKPAVVSPKSPPKQGKVSSKTLVSLKKSIQNQANKIKLVRKEGDGIQSISKSKPIVIEDQSLKAVPSISERLDLKTKLALLDERDKQIREKIVPDSNIKTAVAMKGTCPDMCPERERIMRQYSLSVAVYETYPGTYDMDENKAVKEYTRSSADQDVPLPHDLRPEPVLSMTMNYLITNIINKIDNPDENKAVWYSFCWNRLRSIRKDIILQQLCDLETVKIVEQCARFHICCYDHMWGAEVSGFDDKINTSNLVDCLQTLRHMYEDLAKHNVTCSNESEFYSYLILLKLESGDIMWDYHQYSPKIQLSPGVQFAIQAYLAFKGNMYTKFFSLVREASYLAACLMQRFFVEVRTKALKTMQRAYTHPGRTIRPSLPSSFIVPALKFDSHTNAKIFCERVEVDLKLDCGKNAHDVYISDSSFLIKEKRLPIARAVVGENNPLPLFTPHQVCSSFDEFGQLKPHVSDDEVTNNLESSFSEEDNSVLSSPGSGPQQSSFKFHLSPTKVSENVFDNSFKFEQNTRHIKNEGSIKQSPFNFNNQTNSSFFFNSFKNEKLNFADEAEENYDEMEEDYDVDMMDEENGISPETDTDNTMLLVSQSNSVLKSNELHIQKPFFLQSASTHKNTSNKSIFSGNNVPEMLQTFSFAFSTNESNKPGSEEKSGFENDYKTSPFHTLNKVTSESGISQMKSSIHMQIDDEIKPQPEQGVFNEQTGDVFEEHRKVSPPKRLQKDNKTLLMEKVLKEKAEEEKRKMDEMKREAMERHKKKVEEQKALQVLKKDVSERLKAYNARKYARQWKAKVERLRLKRADLPMLVQLSVSEHLKSWGTVTSLPVSSILQRVKYKRNLTAAASKLLKFGITDSCSYLGPYLGECLARSASNSLRKGDVKPVYWKLGVSVPWISSPSTELSAFNNLMRRWCKQSFYKGTKSQLGSVESVKTSLEMLVNISVHFFDDYQSSCNSQALDALVFVVLSDSESKKTCLQRLRSLVTCHTRVGEFSVAVMNIGGVKFERVLKVELEELHEQNLIAHWTVNNWSNSNSIIESLTFLAEHVNIVPHICAASLEMLVKEVCEDFFDALSCGQHSSVELMEAVKHPNIVISLYNNCLTKLEDALVSSKLEQYFNFAEEFKNYVPTCESGGPELLCGKQYDDAYKVQISNTINSLKLGEFQTWPPGSPSQLVKMVKMYCAEVHDVNVFAQIVRMIDPPDDSDLGEHLQKTPWINIVELWAQCCIRHCFLGRRKSKQLVLFNRNDIRSLVKQHWWLKLPVIARQRQC